MFHQVTMLLQIVTDGPVCTLIMGHIHATMLCFRYFHFPNGRQPSVTTKTLQIEKRNTATKISTATVNINNNNDDEDDDDVQLLQRFSRAHCH